MTGPMSKPARRRCLALVLGAALGHLHCQENELETTCRSICQSLACGDGTSVTPCKRDCIRRADEAQMHGEPCLEAYRVLLECLAPLGCVETLDWETLRGRDFEYDCRPETDIFNEACPGVWFTAE